MNTREHVLGHAIEMIESGSCVDIVGDRGSGRTRMLDGIREHFLNRSWRVESIRCVPSLAALPLVALSMAGIEAARGSRASSLAAVVSELAERLPAGESVLVIDNWDDLDEVSWGAIQSVNRDHGVPFALTRLGGRQSRFTPTGLRGSTMEPSFVISLAPLQYEELQHALDEHLGGSVESATLSLLYAKSGGNVGLALALADAGRWEHSLELQNGQWTASRELWSDSLGLKIEALLESLSERQRDILETLAHVGVADVEAATKFAAVHELEQLEELSLIEFYSADSRYLIGVKPPLLAEYFRHRTDVARRLRIMRTITDALEPGGPAVHIDPVPTTSDSAQFVRLVQEHQRTRLMTTQAEWKRQGTSDAAVGYLDAVMDSAAPCDEIDAVLDATGDSGGTEGARVRWLVRWAEHRAYSHSDPRSAISRLRCEAPAHPGLGGILIARAVEIETELLTVPGLENVPEPTEATDPRVAAAALRARAYVYTTRGQFSESTDALDRLAVIADVSGDSVVASLDAMNKIGRGQGRVQIAESSRRFAEARLGFDPVALRCHGEILAFCAILDGRYSDVGRILDEVHGLGHTSSRPPFAQASLTIMGSVVAALQEHCAGAQSRLEDAHRLRIPDGPFPAQIRGWAEVHAQAALGDLDGAARTATRVGDQLWERGARFAAAVVYLTGLELVPLSGEFDRVSERVLAAGGELVTGPLAYVRASRERDPGAMALAASTLWDQGRFGTALAAYSEAIELYAERDDTDSAARLSEKRDELDRALPEGSHEDVRLGSRSVHLSDRELEIARLVAAGLSNRQVADELYISVRTVETHILHVMRKARVDRRHQLRGFLERTGRA